ncbi:MAG: hypothetical protein HUU50_05470 [Candidatus Brocadiae bacterium]|nr:hypothetical protein [Candidatus Brocadiia bacterium]
MKKFLLVILMLCMGWMVAEEHDMVMVTQAAQDGLERFLALAEPMMLEQMGVKDRAEVRAASLGKPFQMHVITPQALDSYCEGNSVDSLLKAMDSYYFPVLLQGEIKSFLVVALMEEKWEAVSFGYLPLAQEVNRLLLQRQDREHPCLAVMFQARAYLYSVRGERMENLSPLIYGVGVDKSYRELQSLGSTVKILKKMVKDYAEEDMQYSQKNQ